MKKFLRMFILDVERALSLRFAISVSAIVLLMLLDNLWDFRDSLTHKGYTVYHFFFNAVVFSGLFSTYGIGVVCTMPYGQSVTQEFATEMHYQFAARSSRKAYLLSKYAVSVISSGLCVSLGYWTFILLLSLFYPFAGDELYESGMIQFPYVDMLLNGNYIQYIGEIVYNGFLLGSIYGGVCVALSLVFRNKIIVASLPFFVRFGWIQLYRAFKVEDAIRLDRRLMMRYALDSYRLTDLWSLIRTLVLLIVCFILFEKIAERRWITNEGSAYI